jgi:hypothetical protein
MYFMYHHSQHCVINVGPPPPTQSRESFTLFPLLPPELRLKIWQIATDEPQTVELSCTPTSSYLPKGRWFSHNKPPVVFSICAESRDVALSHYSTLTFSPDQVGVPWPKLYFNFSRDTLWLCDDLCGIWARDLLEKNEQLKTQLKFLAVEEKLWKSLNQIVFTPGWDMGGSKSIIGYLKALEDLRFH